MSWIDDYVNNGTALDVTVTLSGRVAPWPGQEVWQFEPLLRIDKGDICNVSYFRVSCHAGTHVDSPWHFGMSPQTVESVPLDQMIVPARVIDLTHVTQAITKADLVGRIEGASAALFKTTNSGSLQSGAPFDTEFIYIAEDAAQYIVECGVRTVGVDYLSVEGFHAAEPVTHRMLLGHDVFIVEGLDLTHAAPGEYLLVVLPLKIEGADGSPARAVLLR
ncbi:MAG: cyclase family protein [Acidobacteria bacterium]|nr:cyclase family protein [Acidobacteriota bacterium]